MHPILLVKPGSRLALILVLSLALAGHIATQLLQPPLHLSLLSHFFLFSCLISRFIDPFSMVVFYALIRLNQLFMRRARQRGHLTDLLGLEGGDVCVGWVIGGFVNADLLSWLLCSALLRLRMVCDRLQRLLPLVLLSTLAVLSGLRCWVFLLVPAVLPPRSILIVHPYISSVRFLVGRLDLAQEILMRLLFVTPKACH